MASCYTLNGITIPENVESYYVANFDLKARNAPPLINQVFTEDLKNKINQQTKLVANDTDPDVEFNGSISSFTLQQLAPTRDQESSLNRLRVSVAVEYTNHRNEDLSWKQTFSQNFDFSPDQDLLSVQDQAIADIYEQIIEQIFNKSFADW
ncbi:LPS assembly lipoprotein LptE [Portibacter marinus]|uniref:LPS assembly lipoprotein LptE n=1 Tax=Portibacter marinus TaxID=2898660 RepID=UPI001F1BCF19|nr:LPS assembly lipoprotein LptE [Portibacter marinus]